MAFYNPLYAAFTIIIILSVLGAFFGAFCAKLVYRLAGGRFKGFAVFSSSFCPSCGKSIKLADKLPIVGYIRTRGHCRRCGAPISQRYLLFEVIGLCLPIILFYYENYTLKAFFDYFFIMLILTEGYISYDTQIYPISLSIFFYVLALTFNLYTSMWIDGLIGAGVSILLSYLLFFTQINKKSIHTFALFAGAVGLYLGWQLILLVYVLYILFLIIEKLVDFFIDSKNIASGSLFAGAALIIDLFGDEILRYVMVVIRFITS